MEKETVKEMAILKGSFNLLAVSILKMIKEPKLNKINKISGSNISEVKSYDEY